MKLPDVLGVLLAGFLLTGVGCRNDQPPQDDVQIDQHPTIRVGMTRDQVLAALGTPTTTQTWVKSPEPIFGVLEAWWPELPEGAKVVIWNFPQADGMVSIYFLGASSNAVWHTSFVKQEVVF